MKKNLLTVIFFLIFCRSLSFGQILDCKHDPKFDNNLSPALNSLINPEKNSNINPKYNWNINPLHNNDVNPNTNSSINPVGHADFNPDLNKNLNPMFHNEYHPKNPAWKGLYLFNKNDEVIGYVSVATQLLMLCFDTQSEWTGFFVKAGNGIYNHFDTMG